MNHQIIEPMKKQNLTPVRVMQRVAPERETMARPAAVSDRDTAQVRNHQRNEATSPSNAPDIPTAV